MNTFGNGFAGKVVFVTGAASGIGRACALAFAEEGASVVVADISTGGGAEVVRQIRAVGGEAMFHQCDVTRDSDVLGTVRAAVALYGRLDCACNNAGIVGEQALTADYSEESWQKVVNVNLTGVWLCMKHEIQAMLRQRRGVIVNVASMLGQVGFAYAAPYVAAKHGVIGLTKTAAIEYADQGIRVNAICPGFIDTPMTRLSGITPSSELYRRLVATQPLKRLGSPEEVAGAVLWLCSDAAAFMTGQALFIDGGYTIQ